MAGRKKAATAVGTGVVAPATGTAPAPAPAVAAPAAAPAVATKAPKGKKAAHKAVVAADQATTVPTAPADQGIVKPPPKAKVPKAPAGFIPPSAADYRGFRPKRAELAVVPDAVMEL